ncbi:L-alanine-DL-glutamate epimerase-like enolase superfamily enzyme [Nocardioides albertanoniae]|uniref:Dipeptide epimerase n=1 Tax=Nocardioides albertanoniae TaxID=1175486 RepID=A0A543ACB5_9ACTN|nr:L-alanine-DL-glutamate epimerase-like enolase superfamily enzyme [Nocardioides albertanoniae]
MPLVAAVRTQRVRVPLHTPFVTALRRTDFAETVVVTVEDSEGCVGWGEAPQVWKVTGESLAGAAAALEGPISDALVGAPADLSSTRVVQGAVFGNRSAKMAADIALYDLVARRAGLPLTDYLSGLVGSRPSLQPTVLTDVTLSVGTPDELAEAAAARAADGFGTLKVKVGTDPGGDAARVLAVREAAPGCRLRLDANTGWRADEALAVLSVLADAGVELEFVEQPVARRDLEAMAHVRRNQPYKILADESVFDLEDLVDVIRAGAADAVNVKLAKCGGLTPAIELLEIAKGHGLDRLVGCMMESHLGIGAASALVTALGIRGEQDLDAGWWARSSPYAGGITYAGPRIERSDGPGLGIEGVL